MNTFTRHLPTAARLLLGLVFTTFGLNGFLRFLSMPPPPPAAGAFFGALMATGYLLPLLMGTQLVAGLLLLSGRFVPLALTLLAPVVVNIVAFHLFLSPAGMGLALLVLALELFLAWSYRAAFAPLLRARSVPAGLARPVQTLRTAA